MRDREKSVDGFAARERPRIPCHALIAETRNRGIVSGCSAAEAIRRPDPKAACAARADAASDLRFGEGAQ
jgi:hypothetical protein